MLDSLTKGYLTLRPDAAARTLASLDERDVRAVFAAMPRHLAAGVVRHMSPASAGRCLAKLPAKASSDILARTNVQTAVAVLRFVERDRVQEILAAMTRPAAARLRLRLRYAETMIGAFIDTDVITLTPEHRVGDALRMFRRAGQRPGKTIPVLDNKRHLVGMVDLSDLLPARDRSMIMSVMNPPAASLNVRAALQTALNHPAWSTSDALPVINRDGIFQGMLWRAALTENERQAVTDFAELAATRAALADIFWIGVGAVFAPRPAPHDAAATND